MKQFLRSEAGAIVVWVLSSLFLAAVIVPWLYRAGMNLGDAAAARDLPGILEWLGASCARAKISRYYSRSLALSALLLLPFLLRRIRLARARSLWSCDEVRPVSWKCGMVQMFVGCLIAGGLLWILGMLLFHWGAYGVSPKQPGAGKILSAVVIPAIGASVLEELLFRGILLGLWLRVSRIPAACLGTSLVFAFIHFLKPPSGYVIANPEHPLAGFELLGKILLHFTDPRFFVTDFATLFVVGMILSWSRLKTGALWFPIGLHAGWILAFKGYQLFYREVPDHPFHPWGIGNSLRSGVFPMLTLAVTAIACHFALVYFERKRLAC